MLSFFNYLRLSKYLPFFKQPLTESELAQFCQHIHQICESVQEKNLTLVSNRIENTSGHNNHKLVKAAVYFVNECVWVFNGNYAGDYAKANYFSEFIVYINEVGKDFEQQNYDPDGVGKGTITDIANKIKNSQLNELE